MFKEKNVLAVLLGVTENKPSVRYVLSENDIISVQMDIPGSQRDRKISSRCLLEIPRNNQANVGDEY